MDPEEFIEVCRQVNLHLSIQKARAGDPWPFVFLQWPTLLIPNGHPDERYFQKFRINSSPETWVTLRIDDFQRDVVESFFDGIHTECAIKGCTKPGKGFSTAMALCVWFDIYRNLGDDPFNSARIIITAPTANKARSGVYGDMVTLRSKMKMPGPGRKTSQELKDHERHYATVLNPEDSESFAGHHGPFTVFVFDEASAVPRTFYKEAQKQSRFIAALSNPRVLTGWFFDMFKSPKKDEPINPDATQSIQTPFGKRKIITVDGADVMNVKHRRMILTTAPEDMEIDGKAYSRHQPIPADVYEQHCRLLIPNQLDYCRYVLLTSESNPNEVKVFAHGHFPKSDSELQVIPFHFIDLNCGSVPVEEIDISAFGLDAAISKDGDKSVLAIGGLRGVHDLRTVQKDSAKDIALWVIGQASDVGIDLCNGTAPICVDETGGYGKQVTQFLKQMGVRVIGIAANGAAKNKSEYFNVRAEMYGQLRRRLDPKGRYQDDPWNLPDDTELHEELGCPEKIYIDGIRYKITPKDIRGVKAGEKSEARTVKGILKRSPDKADAVVHLYHAVAIQESRIDPSNRQLIYNIGEEKPDRRELSQSEQLDRHIAGLAERMDRMYDERYADETWAYGA